MRKKTTITILDDGNTITVNTDGDRIVTIKTSTVYYVWIVPVWVSVRYADSIDTDRKKNSVLCMQGLRHWNGAVERERGMVKCKHGTILYGTHCINCEKELKAKANDK